MQAARRALDVEASHARHLLDECATRLAAAAAASSGLSGEVGRLHAELRRRQHGCDATARQLALAEEECGTLLQSVSSLEARLRLADVQAADARSENQRLQSALGVVRQQLSTPTGFHQPLLASYLGGSGSVTLRQRDTPPF